MIVNKKDVFTHQTQTVVLLDWEMSIQKGEFMTNPLTRMFTNPTETKEKCKFVDFDQWTIRDTVFIFKPFSNNAIH